MNYLSLSFAAFVLLLMLVYYLVPKKARGAVLLCGSLVFYGLFDVRYFLFLLFTALTTFFAAKLLVKSSKTLRGSPKQPFAHSRFSASQSPNLCFH